MPVVATIYIAALMVPFVTGLALLAFGLRAFMRNRMFGRARMISGAVLMIAPVVAYLYGLSLLA